MVEHHALGEQLGKRLVDVHQPQVAHHLGPKARVQQVQDGVLNAAYVLVHAAAAGLLRLVAHPIRRTRAHHLLRIGGVAVAHEIPARIHKGVHGVGLAPRGHAAHRAGDTGVKTLVLVQRVARAVRNAVHGQHHRQVLLRHGHRAVLGAVDDGNRRAPVALAAHTPVAQAPCGFFLSQAQSGQVSGYSVHTGFEGQAIVFAGVDGHARAFFGVPVVPHGGVKRPRLVHRHHLGDGQRVLQRKRKVALIVPGHAHHGAVAIAHEHVVAHPHGHRRAGQGVAYKQAGGHAFFFFDRQLGLGGAAFMAFFNKGSKRRVAGCGVRGQRVLRRHGAKGHAHDGVHPGGEHVHAAVTNQRATGVLDGVRKGKAHALALANPVLLHQLDALGPAR